MTRLALSAGRPVGTGDLIDAVWGDSAPATANNALQTLVSRLRRILPPPAALVAEPTGYRLAGTRLDTEEFERCGPVTWPGRGRGTRSA